MRVWTRYLCRVFSVFLYDFLQNYIQDFGDEDDELLRNFLDLIRRPLFRSGLVLSDPIARTNLIKLFGLLEIDDRYYHRWIDSTIKARRSRFESTLIDLIDCALLDVDPAQREERTKQLFEFLTEPEIINYMWWKPFSDEPYINTKRWLIVKKIADLAIDLQRSMEDIVEGHSRPCGNNVWVMIEEGDTECAIDLILIILKTNPSAEWALKFIYRRWRLFALPIDLYRASHSHNMLEIIRMYLDLQARIGTDQTAKIVDDYNAQFSDDLGTHELFVQAQHNWLTTLVTSSLKNFPAKVVHDADLHRIYSLAVVVAKYITIVYYNEARDDSSPKERLTTE